MNTTSKTIAAALFLSLSNLAFSSDLLDYQLTEKMASIKAQHIANMVRQTKLPKHSKLWLSLSQVELVRNSSDMDFITALVKLQSEGELRDMQLAIGLEELKALTGQ